MKGIILAGGSGTRLYPVTKSISKQIVPVYDKPMIYYPLSTLMLAGIRDILVISTERDISTYKELLGNGLDLGIKLTYKTQCEPKGLAEAFIIGESFIGKDNVALVLGDNIFYSSRFSDTLHRVSKLKSGAVMFGYYVSNPSEFGVVEFDKEWNVVSLEEKPEHPKSNYAVPGLYFYDNNVIEIAKSIQPSKRGELEITSINEEYRKRGQLKVELFGRGMAWLDTGTHDGLLAASNFVQAVQKRQSLYISCIEEIAYRMRYIDRNQLIKLAQPMLKSDYGKYLIRISEEDI